MNKLQRLLSTGLVLLMVAACSPATSAVPTTAPTPPPPSAPVATQLIPPPPTPPPTAPTQTAAQPTTAPTSAATAASQGAVQLVFLTFETPVLTADFWDSNIAIAQKVLPPNVTIKRIVSPGIDRTTYAKQLLASNQFP